MQALALVHHGDTETGTIGERMLELGFDLEVATAYEHLPDPRALDVVVVYGSGASAYDDSLPWLGAELDYLDEVIAARTPIFGICFGGQLLARALGGKVAPSNEHEAGWTRISTREPGLVAEGPWLEFHFDRFTLPAGGIAVARTRRALQAFTHGPHLGVQFHPEISPSMFEQWIEQWRATGELETYASIGIDADRIAADFAAHGDEARVAGRRLFDNFFERAQRIGRTRALASRGA